MGRVGFTLRRTGFICFVYEIDCMLYIYLFVLLGCLTCPTLISSREGTREKERKRKREREKERKREREIEKERKREGGKERKKEIERERATNDK